MNPENTSPDAIDGGQAEAWLARLHAPDCSAGERAEFEDWLAQAPANIEAYLEIERIQSMVAELSSDELLRAAARSARRMPPVRPASRRWLPIGSAIAATLAVAVGTVLWFGRAPEVAVVEYATAVGEQRTLTLADGTQVLLDTNSSLATRFDADSRDVELRQGRAQFVVGKDPQRPFVVHAGSSTVRDIGTTFQVSRAGSDVNVGLIEGAVVVAAGQGAAASSAMLAPGEQVTVSQAGVIADKQPLDVAVAKAWPLGDLVFKDRRLDLLVDEMNRYSRTQLRLADPSLGEVTVSGVFHIGDQDALVAVLERGWSLRAERTNGEIVLHRDES